MKDKIKAEDIDWGSMTIIDLLLFILMAGIALFGNLMAAVVSGVIIFGIIIFIVWIPTLFNYDIFYELVLHKGIFINPEIDFILYCVIGYYAYPSIEKWRRRNRFKV